MSSEEAGHGLEVCSTDSLQLASKTRSVAPSIATYIPDKAYNNITSTSPATIGTTITEATYYSFSPSSALSISSKKSAANPLKSDAMLPTQEQRCTQQHQQRQQRQQTESAAGSGTMSSYYSFSDTGGISSSSNSFAGSSSCQSYSLELEYSDEDLSITGPENHVKDMNAPHCASDGYFITYNANGDEKDNCRNGCTINNDEGQNHRTRAKNQAKGDGTMSNDFDLGTLQFDKCKSSSSLYPKSSSSDRFFPSTRTLDLVIDELPTRRVPMPPLNHPKSKLVSLPNKKANKAAVGKEGKVGAQSSKLKGEKSLSRTSSLPPVFQYEQSNDSKKDEPNNDGNVFTSFLENFWPMSNHIDTTKKRNQDSCTTSTSSPSAIVNSLVVGYTIKKTIMEGWLNKKGTGNDLFQSTSWKPRWCSIIMASFPECDYDIPLLLVSRQFAVNPSNLILLEYNVAIKVDQSTTTKHNNNTNDASHVQNRTYCFDIVSTKERTSSSSKTNSNNFYNTNNNENKNKQSSTSSCSPSALSTTSTLFNGKLTRTFSTASKEDRDKWVQSINETIECHERSKSRNAISSEDRSLLSSLLPPTSPGRKGSGQSADDQFDLSGLSILHL